MSDVNISKFRAQVVRDGSKPATPGFVVSEGQSPTDPAGSGQNHLPVTIAAASTGLAITESQILGGAGTVSQYIRGDGSLADFPSITGGGSSVSYYLNGSVSQGTIGGVAYRELNRTPIFGAGTDISINANGYIASFITDAGDPNKLLIPAGNWNFETYFSANSGGGSPSFYVELYKYDGTTFTLIASSSSSPELIAFGTSLNPYFSTLAVPQTTLALTDRLAVRFYVNHSGRTITLHTENGHLCQIITSFTTGLTALNGLTNQVQFFAVGTSGTDFAISSASDTHTFNLPTASATNRGALSSADWTTFNNKENAITAGTTAQYYRGDKTFQTLNTSVVPELTNLYYTEARVNANTNVAANTAARHNAVTLGTANGLSLSTQVLSLGLASAGVTGALSGTDWSTFNNKQNALTLTTTGTSGAATLVGSTLNIPQYQAAGTYVTAVTASSPLASSGGTTPNITIQQASGSQNGFLSSTDWTTFNNKQNALTNPVTGTGTTNYLPKFTGTSTIGNSQVFDNGTNVGIGTASPAGLLHVKSSGAYGAILVDNTGTTGGGYFASLQNGSTKGIIAVTGAIEGNTTSDFGMFAETGGALRFYVNGSATRSMSLTSGGNLLVGTTTDNGARLQVSGSATIGGNLTISSGNNLNVVTGDIHFQSNAGYGILSQNGNRLLSIQNGAFGVSGAATFSSSVTATELYLSTSSGLVGNINSSNANGGYLTWQTSGTTIADIGTAQQIFGSGGNTVFGINGRGARAIAFGTNDTERMRITSSGNVGIGTTSPGARLNIAGNLGAVVGAGNSAIRMTNTDSGNYASIGAGIVGVDNPGMQFSVDGTSRMVITGGGNLLVGTTTDNGNKLRVNGVGFFDQGVRTGQPVGTTTNNWLLGRALASGTSTPNRWIRVQIGLEYYDILAVYMGTL